jgi:hypothetical protein
MIYTVGYAAQSVQNDRRKRSGFWKLSAADQAAVASAFWRGRPISRVLAPALLEYCGTASNVVYRSRRYLWCPVASAAVLAIAGTALFLSDVPDAVIRGAILLAIGLVMVIAVIGELRRIRRLPPKIRRAQRLAQASLVRRAGSDTPNSPLLSSSSRLEGSHEAQ